MLLCVFCCCVSSFFFFFSVQFQKAYTDEEESGVAMYALNRTRSRALSRQAGQMKPSFYSAKSDRRYASLEGGRRYSTCLAKRKRRVRSVCELSDDEDPGQQFDDDIVLTTPTTDKNALVKGKNSKTLKKRKQQTTLFFPTVKQPDRRGNGTQIRKYGKSVQKIHDKRAKPLKRSVPKSRGWNKRSLTWAKKILT